MELYYGLSNGGVQFSAPPIPKASVNAPLAIPTKGGGAKVREVSEGFLLGRKRGRREQEEIRVVCVISCWVLEWREW